MSLPLCAPSQSVAGACCCRITLTISASLGTLLLLLVLVLPLVAATGTTAASGHTLHPSVNDSSKKQPAAGLEQQPGSRSGSEEQSRSPGYCKDGAGTAVDILVQGKPSHWKVRPSGRFACAVAPWPHLEGSTRCRVHDWRRACLPRSCSATAACPILKWLIANARLFPRPPRHAAGDARQALPRC